MIANIAKFQNKASTSQIFSKNLFADSVSFTLSHFVNVPHFPLYIVEINEIKTHFDLPIDEIRAINENFVM